MMHLGIAMLQRTFCVIDLGKGHGRGGKGWVLHREVPKDVASGVVPATEAAHTQISD